MLRETGKQGPRSRRRGPLTICRKALESLVREKVRSGTQRGISPSMELARARCSLASMAFSSFCVGSVGTGWEEWPGEGLCQLPPSAPVPVCPLPPHPGPDPFLAGSQDEEGLNVLLLEVGVALPAAARLHLIVPVQVLQRGPSDVDAAARAGQEGESPALPRAPTPRPLDAGSPGPAPGLHVIGQSHVIGPHIELPFPQAKDAAVHAPTVDAHAHVHVHTCHLAHQPGRRRPGLAPGTVLPTPSPEPRPCARLGAKWARTDPVAGHMAHPQQDTGKRLHGAQGQMFGNPAHQQGPSSILWD